MSAAASSFGQWRTGAFGSEGQFTSAAQSGAHNIRRVFGFAGYGFAHYAPANYRFNGRAWAWTNTGLWANWRGYYYSTEPQTFYVDVADETDSALALSAIQILATGRSDETDSALALAGVVVGPVGLATETDTALTLGVARPAGISTETDTALTLASARPADVATETDTALALAGLSVRAVGMAAETDTALGLGAARPAAVSLETDSSLALSAVQILPAGTATETDEALALSSPASGTPVGMATETDTAWALAAVHNVLAAATTPDGGGRSGRDQMGRLTEAAQIEQQNQAIVALILEAVAQGAYE